MKPILTAKRPVQPWHAVSVVVKAGCCDSAKQLRNVRFLSAQAPRFPLENCTNPPHCQCSYRHFDDRRAGSRRQGEMGVRKARKGQQERRQGADRRRADYDF